MSILDYLKLPAAFSATLLTAAMIMIVCICPVKPIFNPAVHSASMRS